MPVESAADRLAFLEPEEFGTTASYDGAAVQGVLMRGYQAAEYGAEVAVASAQPVFLCREADVAGVVQGDAIIIPDDDDGVTYTVAGVRPDGEGMVHLDLEQD